MKNKTIDFELHASRLIEISKERPLNPQTFIPWNDEPDEDTLFMPEKLISLQGHELWHNLTPNQQKELGRLEMVQVMYSYAWSETLACSFFNRHLLSLNPTSVEYKFLIRELIEEYQHQEMFGMAIEKLKGTPVKSSNIYQKVAGFCVKYGGASILFMGVMAIELMADIYAKHIRKDPKVYSVLRKVSELHHIEEGRHILYTKMWLSKFTQNAGFFRSTVYSLVVLGTIHFLKSLYVQESFLREVGVEKSKEYYQAAIQNLNEKFTDIALSETVEFVKSFQGFNWFTKLLWRRVLKVNV